ARQALAVNPDEHAFVRGYVAGDEGEVLLAVEERLEAVGGELAIGGRDAGGRDSLDELLAAAPVANEVCNRDDEKPVMRSKLLKLGLASHLLLVGADDLAEQSSRVATGHASEVDRRLGVAGTFEDAAWPIAQRQ